MAYDIQLLVQASVYFLIFILSFVVAIPIGVNVIELNGKCMLYSDIDWDSHTYSASSASTCYFPVYVAVTFIFYSLALGIYNMYVAFRSKDPHIGYKMWVLPLIVLTAIAMILTFVVSCILSVGIAHTCRSIMKLKDKGVHIEQCSDIQELYGKYERLDEDSFRHFYSYPKTSELVLYPVYSIIQRDLDGEAPYFIPDKEPPYYFYNLRRARRRLEHFAT